MAYDWLNMFTIKKQTTGSTCHFLPKCLKEVQRRYAGEKVEQDKQSDTTIPHLLQNIRKKNTNIFTRRQKTFTKVIQTIPVQDQADDMSGVQSMGIRNYKKPRSNNNNPNGSYKP